jgi:hypothetical protein
MGAKMKTALFVMMMVPSAFAVAQSASNLSLAPGTSIPIGFSHGIDASHVRNGDVVSAKTTQPIQMVGRTLLPAGADVVGHVVSADGFKYDKTPYVEQKLGSLTIRFDTLRANGVEIPLHVYIRALADPVSVRDAELPNAYDDGLRTRRQIGGDEVTPSQDEVLSRDGDTVGYLKHGGVYAHLIAANGNSPDGCDGTNSEQAMGLFSASACGLYGFTDIKLVETGRKDGSSTLSLVSRRHSPQIWKNSVALLEVVSPTQAVASR